MTVRTKHDREILHKAIGRLEALIDEQNPVCSVGASHKNAVRPYVECWILAELRKLRHPEDKF